MAKYLTEFNTYADYSGATLSLPNVSLIKNTGQVFYKNIFAGATVGDVLMWDVANNTFKMTLNALWDATTYPIVDYLPIAVNAIPASETPDGKGRWMNLLNLDTNGYGTTGNTTLVWSTEKVDCGTSTDTNNYVGRSNTNAILATANYSQSTYPAAYAVNAYSTSGTSAGDWYLPSIGELKAVYSGKTTIQAQLTLIKNADSSKARPLEEGIYWSSSEANSDNAYALNFYNGGNVSNTKNYGYTRVRAFLML